LGYLSVSPACDVKANKTRYLIMIWRVIRRSGRERCVVVPMPLNGRSSHALVPNVRSSVKAYRQQPHPNPVNPIRGSGSIRLQRGRSLSGQSVLKRRNYIIWLTCGASGSPPWMGTRQANLQNTTTGLRHGEECGRSVYLLFILLFSVAVLERNDSSQFLGCVCPQLRVHGC